MNSLKIFRSGLAGADAEDEAAVLLNGLGDVFGVELDLRIEERKAEYQKRENYHIEPRTRAHISLPPDVEGATRPEHSGYHFREGKDGEREYKGHNAVRVDFDGDNGRLAAVHLSAFDLFGVLNGNSSFGEFNPDDKPEYEDNGDDVAYYSPESRKIETAGHESRDGSNESVARGSENTYEDEKRYTVGNAVFGDPFAYPYGDESARRVESYDNDIRKPYLIEEYFAQSKVTFGVDDVVVKGYENTDCLNDRKDQRAVSRKLGYLLLTFFALLAHSLKRGDRNGQKLQNNRSVDVRSDTHSEPGTVSECATCHHTHNAEIRYVGYLGSVAARAHAGNRNITPYSVNQDKEQSHPDLDSYFLDLKGVF